MKRPTRHTAVPLVRRLAAPIGAAALIAAIAMPTPALGQGGANMVALTANNQLVRFSGSTPGTVASTVAITGLQSGEALHGIDFRPANGRLYTVSSTGRILTIDPMSGAATQSGSASLNLMGTNFGVDFNPVPDRLRLVSDGAQNLRVNVDTAEATIDGTLKFAAGDANASATPKVVAAGYTNSMAGAQSTTLFVIDSGLDILARQDPPNDGTLNTIGKLGMDVADVAGFDIAPDGNQAFAALNMAGGSSTDLYSINLTSGAATRVGPIGSGQAIRGLAAILPMPAAAPAAQPSPAAQPAAPAAPAAKPAAAPPAAAPPAAAPPAAAGPAQMPMPAALPRAGEAEDQQSTLAGLVSVGAGLLLAGSALVLRRRRA